MIIERKAISLPETKFASVDEDTRSFDGYGSVFDVIDSYGDVVTRNAFDETIEAHRAAGTMPFMFLNHDMYALPIGKYTEMTADERGLKLAGQLIDTVAGRDTYTALRAGVVDGLSIGFYVTGSEEHRDGGPMGPNHRRTITKVDLVEVSVVTMPANGAARVSDVRSMLQEGMTIRDLETLLRRFVSRSEALAITSQFESKDELRKAEEERAIVAMLNEVRWSLRK